MPFAGAAAAIVGSLGVVRATPTPRVDPDMPEITPWGVSAVGMLGVRETPTPSVDPDPALVMLGLRESPSTPPTHCSLLERARSVPVLEAPAAVVVVGFSLGVVRDTSSPAPLSPLPPSSPWVVVRALSVPETEAISPADSPSVLTVGAALGVHEEEDSAKS